VPMHAIETVRLIAVSREPAVLRPLWSIADANSWQLETVSSGWEAMERLQAGAAADLLLLEGSGNDGEGLHVLRWLHRLRPHLPIILISHTDEAKHNQEAIGLGARAILNWPLEEQQLEFVVRRNLGVTSPGAENGFRSEDVEAMGDGAFFVGASPVMRQLRAQAKLLAQSQVPVLILGESGSGKSTAAQLIHGLSVRRGPKLLKVNCAALPGHLLEKELFGWEKEAEGRVAGKLELCGQGTLLLQEIAEMPLELQHKLLQVLQSKHLVRQGGEKPIEVEVRILAATSADVDRAVAGKKLREDLYYRLGAFTLQVPPLRQRKEEIPILLHHFTQQLAWRYGLPARSFSPAALEACQRYSWPGNLTELATFAKRYLMAPDREYASGQATVLEAVADVNYSFPRLAAPASDFPELPPAPDSLKSLVQGVKLEAEKNAITAALRKTGWNRKAAARMLKVSYRTVLYKIDQYHLRPFSAPQSPEEHILPVNGNGFKGNRTAG
jgi:two-component system, NtrC family, response regulator AtoC